jgi:hypothetical protein
MLATGSRIIIGIVDRQKEIVHSHPLFPDAREHSEAGGKEI